MSKLCLPGNATQLLISSLGGDKTAQNSLFRVSKRYLLKSISFKAKGFPEYQYEDILQEVWLLLLNDTPLHFCPSEGHTVKKYFKLLIFNAIKIVRAKYCAPGLTTRPKRDKSNNKWIERRNTYSIDQEINSSKSHSNSNSKTSVAEYIPELESSEKNTLSELDKDIILSYCTEDEREGICLYWMGYKQEEIAVMVGKNRISLFRKINKFVNKIRFY